MRSLIKALQDVVTLYAHNPNEGIECGQRMLKPSGGEGEKYWISFVDGWVLFCWRKSCITQARILDFGALSIALIVCTRLFRGEQLDFLFFSIHWSPSHPRFLKDCSPFVTYLCVCVRRISPLFHDVSPVFTPLAFRRFFHLFSAKRRAQESERYRARDVCVFLLRNDLVASETSRRASNQQLTLGSSSFSSSR